MRGRTKKQRRPRSLSGSRGRTGDDVPGQFDHHRVPARQHGREGISRQARALWTSTICVFEVLNGPAGSPNFDPIDERQTFGGVQALEFNEQLSLEASRLQDASIKDGSELSHRDAMVAATARSTGDEYVVADSDFETDPLEDVMEVTNLYSGCGV